MKIKIKSPSNTGPLMMKEALERWENEGGEITHVPPPRRLKMYDASQPGRNPLDSEAAKRVNGSFPTR